MKKFLLFSLIVMLLTAICVFGCGFMMTPQPALVAENMAVGNVLYLGSTRGGDVKFYMVDGEGQVNHSFATTQPGQLEAMVGSGDDLYISMRDLGKSTIEKWSSGKTVQTVGVLEQGTVNQVLDLAYYQDELYVTGIMSDGVSLGIYQMKEEGFELTQMYNLTGIDVVDAIYFNRELLVQNLSGNVYLVDETGVKLVKEPVENTGFLVHNGASLTYYDIDANTSTNYSGDSTTITDLDTNQEVKNAVGGGNFWAVTVNNLGYATLLHGNGAEMVEGISVTGTAEWYMEEGQTLLFVCLGIVAVLVGAMFLTYAVMKHSKRLVLKALCITVWYAALVGFGLYWVEASGMVNMARSTWFMSVLTGLSLIYILFICSMVYPMGKMATFAENIYKGDYTRFPQKLPGDEVGRIGHGLNGIASQLEQTAYNNRKTMRVYNRFVPKDIQNIFGKSSVMELESGQATTLTTMIGVVSVSNRYEVRKNVKDETYTGWMMHTLNTINSVAKNHRAVPAGTGCSLQGVNLLYHDNPNDAMTYGIELFSRQRGGDAYAKIPINYSFMVHYGDAIYGMGGDADQAFMFLASQELETLQAYQDRMGQAGVRMVMTEQAQKQVTSPVDYRYLGFIGEGSSGFKMYEVLNVLPEKERQLKLRTAEDFEKGLMLFYKNDFYLARNKFSAIVKKNPTDGIARWYVFACERAFQNGGKDSSYSLFSHSELDVKAEKQAPSYV
ncbi:MAG: hypothetical protein R3Y62_00635 [Eubacteriales bacterium]